MCLAEAVMRGFRLCTDIRFWLAYCSSAAAECQPKAKARLIGRAKPSSGTALPTPSDHVLGIVQPYSISRYPTFVTFWYQCLRNRILGTEVGRGGLVDERVDWNGMLPNHWIPQDHRMPSITLAHVIDDVFELVSGGASNADVIPARQGRP